MAKHRWQRQLKADLVGLKDGEEIKEGARAGMVKCGWGAVTKERWEEVKARRKMNAAEALRQRAEKKRNKEREWAMALEAGKEEITEETGSRLERCSISELVRWVIEHVDDDYSPRGMPARAKVLYKRAIGDRNKFIDTYLPLIMKAEESRGLEAQEENVRQSVRELREATKKLEEWVGNGQIEELPPPPPLYENPVVPPIAVPEYRRPIYEEPPSLDGMEPVSQEGVNDLDADMPAWVKGEF